MNNFNKFNGILLLSIILISVVNGFTYSGNKILCVFNESNNKTCLSFNQSINTSNMERLELNNVGKSINLPNFFDLFIGSIIYVVLTVILLAFVLKLLF